MDHLILYFTLAAAMFSAGYCGIPDEIVYLTNCADDHNLLIAESQMNYYKEYANSKAGQLPDSTATVKAGGFESWYKQPVTGTFNKADGGVQFTVSGLDFDTPIGQQTGYGSNGFANFTCYREQVIPLYQDGGLVCTKIFSCAHSNHIVFTQTQPILSSKAVNSSVLVSVPPRVPLTGPFSVPLSGNVVFSSAFSAFDNETKTCSGASFPVGDDCKITFACSAPDFKFFDSMAQYFIQGAGANIPTRTVTDYSTCLTGAICKHTQISTFPTSGSIDAFNVDMANPNNPSIQGSLSYSISCPATPQCDINLCKTIASAVGQFSLQYAFYPLGNILELTCSGCE